MPRVAVRTKRPWGRINRVVILLCAGFGTAASIAIPTTIAGGAIGDGGTTVGSAHYTVPSRAIVVSPSGSDSAAGTSSAPLRTLAHAVASASSGATIVLREGAYHDSVVVPSTKRLTIQAWPGEEVWLDGSVPVTGWTSSGGLWSKSGWTVKFDASPTYTRGAADNTDANWGFVDPSYPMAAHPDQVWINGVAQRQVRSKAKVVPGTFYVDYAADQVWLGSSPSGKEVRASDLVRALMIRSAGSVVRGVGVRRFAPSVPDMGAVTVENNGVLIENVAITDSATTGLHVGSGTTTSGVIARNVRVSRSGMLGINASYADHLTLDHVVSANNNTEHFNTSPVSGGVKIGRSRGITVRDSVFSDNDGPGLWIDESSYDTTVTNSRMSNNAKHGISLEISAKAVVTNNTVVGNDGYGIKVNNTSNVTIEHNAFSRNDRSINIVQDSRLPTSASTAGRDKRQPFPDPTMTWRIGPVRVANNVLANQRSGNCMLCVEDYTQTRSAEQIGVTANGDIYMRPNASLPTYLVVWSRGPGNPAVYNDLASFRAATGQEASGRLIRGPGGPPGPPPDLEPAATQATDTFGRTVAQGLGTADLGGAWTVSGPASSFSVAHGAGRISGAVAKNRAAYLTGVRQADLDVTTDVALERAASGGGAYVSLIGRRVSDGNDYRLKLRYMPGGSVVIYLVRTVGGTETVLADTTVPGLTVKPGDVLRARFVVGGTGTTTLRAKVWRRHSQEPQSWLLTGTDATPAVLRNAGDVGVLLYVSHSWLGAAPAITLDNFSAGGPKS
jgi:parallel beta-helix repeat protein